ncbi:rod shape-determining protein MreC [Patescibacteria group bacterium]
MRLIIISAILLVFGVIGITNPIRNIFQQVASPIQFGLRKSAINIKDTTRLFFRFNIIREENILLTTQVAELKSQLIESQIALEENKILKDQLKLSNDFDIELVFASVLGNPKDPTGASIYIDRGSKHGIQMGDNVVLGNNLVGIVTGVDKFRSEVALTNSVEFGSTVRDLSTGAEGLAKGNLGTSIEVSRILVSDSVFVEDIFITSGADGIFLPNFVVGSVSEVLLESAAPLKSVILKQPFNIKNVDKVFVVLSQ